MMIADDFKSIAQGARVPDAAVARQDMHHAIEVIARAICRSRMTRNEAGMPPDPPRHWDRRVDGEWYMHIREARAALADLARDFTLTVKR